jgi:sugar-specific transcriptional regulator TrmB
METEILSQLGLTKGEITVYLALNKLGESTIGPIGKESTVSKSKIYDILEKLIDKGLIGYIIKNDTKHFLANDPRMILEYIQKKENTLEQTKESAITELLPQLLLQRATASKKRIAEMYQGFEGIKAIREELLSNMKKESKLLVLGAPKVANVRWEGWFLDFHKRRIKKSIAMDIIYNADAQEFGKVRKKMKLTKVKYLPNKLVSPNWIDVFEKEVLFIILLKNPIAFVIRDETLANSFKSYFQIMWDQSIQ